MKISIFASAIRTNLWSEQLQSLEKNKVDWELVYVGPKQPDFHHPKLRWFYSDVKPAQCCEAARRRCTGDILHWTADDAVYPEGILDDIVRIFEINSQEKIIVACETIENSKLCPYDSFTFFDNNKYSPLMVPFGFIRKSYMDRLGGFDRKYVGGQYENDFLMRCHKDGVVLIPYNKKHIEADHINKHTNKHSSFSDWHGFGREVFQNTWRFGGYQPHSLDGEVLKEPKLPFEPYSDFRILEESQGPKGNWQ